MVTNIHTAKRFVPKLVQSIISKAKGPLLPFTASESGVYPNLGIGRLPLDRSYTADSSGHDAKPSEQSHLLCLVVGGNRDAVANSRKSRLVSQCLRQYEFRRWALIPSVEATRHAPIFHRPEHARLHTAHFFLVVCRCESAEPAALFEAALVRPSRSTCEALDAALDDVTFLGAATCERALPAAVFEFLPVEPFERTCDAL